MASFQLAVFFLLCSVTALASGRIVPRRNGIDALARNEGPIHPPIIPERGTFGFGCPMARTYEEYLMTCAQFIGPRCSCVYDDMIIQQSMCVSGDGSHYEEMVQKELELEEMKDRKRVRDGGLSSGERYFELLDCLHSAKKLVRERNGNADE